MREQIIYSFVAASLLAAVFAGGHFSPAENVRMLPASATPVPLPTDIDQNFLEQVNKCFIPIAAMYGYTLRISSGFRTAEAQQALYEQGRTETGHIVTEAQGGKSIHNFGYAVDVVDRFRGFDINWARLGSIGEYCGLEYIEDGDSPHFEHRNGLTTEEFIAGIRPPQLTLPCPVLAERTASSTKLTLKDLQGCDIPKF